MRFDFHTHTHVSHDAFTSQQELLSCCKTKGINILGITEHDKKSKLDPRSFEKEGIWLVNGCEFTTKEGAHIIGLFIKDYDLMDNTKEGIISFIKEQKGLMIMPHPYKKGTGYISIYGDDEEVNEFDFIELINGGVRKNFHYEDIIRIARSKGLLMISSSDSHKANQVGLCVTQINKPISFNSHKELKEALLDLKQDNIDLLLDKSLIKTEGRRNNKIQDLYTYQKIISLLPFFLKRFIKIINYRLSKGRFSKTPNFEKFIIKQPYE